MLLHKQGLHMIKLSSEQIREISGRTVAHYNSRPEDFFAGTRDHDVSQNIKTLLEHIQGKPPFRILDFGCGPGRDLLTFKKLGHHPIGLEGAEKFCAMATEYAECEILHQDFLNLDLPESTFDGIFANASLFHVPLQELSRVLTELRISLKSSGVLFSSNPRGNNDEGWNGNRYGSYHCWESWKRLMTEAGYELITHYYRPPGLPREQQPWLASAWRKTE